MTYQLMPGLTTDEYEALRADIAERGVMVAVEVDENGAILDGHNRVAIATELGISYPTVIREGFTEAQKVAHVLALNLARRQLTRERRAEVVADLRRLGMSLRTIAKVTGVDVATVHRDLAPVASATPDAITGSDGKTYPAHRPDPELLAFRESRLAADPAIQLTDLRLRWGKVALRLSEIVLVDPNDYLPHLERSDYQTLPGLISSVRTWLDRVEAGIAEASRPRVAGGTR